MEWQGKIDFQKPITINGKPHGIEHLATVPVWTSEDHGRIVHTENDDRLYIGTATSWFEMLHSVEPHNHDDRYYTESEIQDYFSGVGGSGKLQVNWINILDKPLTFPATPHEHTQYYLESNVTFTAFNNRGLVGSNANSLAVGNHLHNDLYSPIGHDHDYVSNDTFTSRFSGLNGITGKAQVHWDNVTEKQLNFALAGHEHDADYYPRTEANTTFISQTYMTGYESDIQTKFTEYYTSGQADALLINKSDTTHHHDSVYSKLDHNHDLIYAGISHEHAPSEISFSPSLTPFDVATTTVDKALKELALMKFSGKNEVYVDPEYDASGNKLRAPDGTIDAPFLSISSALLAIQSINGAFNTTIYVAPGTYTGNIILPNNVSLVGSNFASIDGTVTTGTGVCSIKNIALKEAALYGITTLENVTIIGGNSLSANGGVKILFSTIQVPIQQNSGSLTVDNCIIMVQSNTGIKSTVGCNNTMILNSVITSNVTAIDLFSDYNIVNNCIIETQTSEEPLTAICYKVGSTLNNILSGCVVVGNINVSPNMGLSIAGLIHKSGEVYAPDGTEIKWDLPPDSYRNEILARSKEFAGLTLHFDEFQELRNSESGLEQDQNYFIS
jgi:hypothetical protein